MNPTPGSKKRTLLLSGRLLPEFDKRRNILDMFQRPKPITKAISTSETSVVSHKGLEDSGSEPAAKRPRVASSPKRKVTASRYQPNIRTFFQAKSSANKPAGSSQSKLMENPIDIFLANDNTNSESNATIGDSILLRADQKAWKLPQNISQAAEAQGSEASLEDIEDLAAKADDLESSKTEWTKIFSRRDPPRCEGHDEPCKCFETKKKGVNSGRHFWICAR
jgi:AP endonuclease 2